MVHWGEGRGGWRVYGQHFMKDGRSNPVRVAAEDVNDCSIYDGWWNRKRKKRKGSKEEEKGVKEKGVKYSHDTSLRIIMLRKKRKGSSIHMTLL